MNKSLGIHLQELYRIATFKNILLNLKEASDMGSFLVK